MEFNTKMDRVRNINKAYASDLAYIQQWARITFGNFSFPMTEREVLLFITDHLQGMEVEKEKQLMSPLLRNGYKAKPGLHSLATVRRRLSALTAYHKELNYEDPCSGKAVKHLLHTIPKIGKKTMQQKAMTKDIFEKLLAVCDDSIKGVRDRAILLLGWTSGGLRRSEIATAQVEHLTSIGDDFLLHISVKNSKRNHTIKVPVKGKAAQALRNWMVVATIRQGGYLSSSKQGRRSL